MEHLDQKLASNLTTDYINHPLSQLTPNQGAPWLFSRASWNRLQHPPGTLDKGMRWMDGYFTIDWTTLKYPDQTISLSYSACWQSFILKTKKKKKIIQTQANLPQTLLHARALPWLGTNVLPISHCHLNYLKDAPISMHLESITGWTMASNLLATCYAEIILLGTAG